VDWTQRVNRSVTGMPIQGTWGDYWLDNSPFWGSLANVNPTNTVSFVDNPGIGTMLGVVPVSLTDLFQTYLMWNPGDDSIWVTLGIVSWGWSGTEWWGTTLTSSSVTPPTYSDSDDFPVWSHTIHASTGQ
jgi:hypothetical protein